MGRIHVKRAIKRGAGWLSVASGLIAASPPTPWGCVLTYHRIVPLSFIDPRFDDWNVSPDTLERHLSALSRSAEIVGLEELWDRLSTARTPSRPMVCLTFDDGFANFRTHALPVLQRHGVPATIFVPTSALETAAPMSFDRWALHNRHRVGAEAWRALRWDELEECLDSGLVTIGSHSHRHCNGCECTAEELWAEAEDSREILARRLGSDNIRCYAYPFGSSRLGQVTREYVEAVRDAGYRLAVSTDLGLATAASNPLLLPRIEAHATDNGAVLRAKTRGSLAPYYLTDRLRRAARV